MPSICLFGLWDLLDIPRASVKLSIPELHLDPSAASNWRRRLGSFTLDIPGPWPWWILDAKRTKPWYGPWCSLMFLAFIMAKNHQTSSIQLPKLGCLPGFSVCVWCVWDVQINGDFKPVLTEAAAAFGQPKPGRKGGRCNCAETEQLLHFCRWSSFCRCS